MGGWWLRARVSHHRAADKTRTWNFINHFREGGISDGVPGSKWITMPQFFKAAGYTTNGRRPLACSAACCDKG